MDTSGHLYESLAAAKEAGAKDAVEVVGSERAIIEMSTRLRTLEKMRKEPTTPLDFLAIAQAEAKREMRRIKRLPPRLADEASQPLPDRPAPE
jgi:hypothetical protein